MAQVDKFSDTWRTVNDIARMMHASLDLPHTIQLTGANISQALSKDLCTKDVIDSRDFNSTGVFRDTYTRPNKVRIKSLYLCQPGKCPQMPAGGHKWCDFVAEPLNKTWVPSRCSIYPRNYESLKECLKNLLRTPNNNDEGGKRKSKRKSTEHPNKDSNSLKKCRGTKKSFIRLLTSNNSVICVEIDESTVEKLTEAIATQVVVTKHQEKQFVTFAYQEK